MKNILIKPVGAILGVVLMSLAFSAQANVIVIDQASNKATVDCTAGTVDPACEGVIGSPTGTLSASFADIYDVSPSNPSQETAFLNSLMNLSLKVGDATKIEVDQASATFTTSALWFAIKTGKGHSFFRNNGGLIDLTVLYKGGEFPQGMGLSHITFWGGTTTQVPEPGTLALLGMGILGFGLMRRRRAA